MTHPLPRLVYDRDAAPRAHATPAVCQCAACRQLEDERMPVRTMGMAVAGVVVGTLLPFAWDARGMVGVLASMIGVRL